MPAPTNTTARTRRSRTRTRVRNPLPAIRLGTLKAHEVDFHPDCTSMVCPDCRTWCPITNLYGAHPRLVPHHNAPAGTPDARRCRSSNRSLIPDHRVMRWARDLEEGVPQTNARRRTRVNPKPKQQPAPAIVQLAASRPAGPATFDEDAPELTAALRRAAWAAVLPSVRAADTARAQTPAGDTPTHGPDVPTEPRRPTR